MTLKKLAIAVYLILLHLVAGVALVKTDLLSRVATRLGLAMPAIPDGGQTVATWRAFHGTIDSRVPDGATIFLGDSITRAMAVKDITPKAINYGIGWQRSDQLIVSMDTYASLQRASQVVVMIGTNDLLQGKDADIEARYRTILAKIPARLPVLMIGLPPLAPTAAALRGRIEGARVRAAVASAQRACASRPACSFVSAHAALSEMDTALPGVLQPDGIHLAPHGYELLTALIRQALNQPEARVPTPP